MAGDLLDDLRRRASTVRTRLNGLPRRSYRPGPSAAPPPARRPGSRRRPLPPDGRYDLVFFWRQNDTSIYGRRQDMLLKYLERSGRFRRIVHFDRPITPEALVLLAWGARRGRSDQSGLVLRQTLGRLVGRRRGNVGHHTFLYAGRRTGRLLPPREAQTAYVASVLAREGIGDRPTVFWVYPTNVDFPAIVDQLHADIVVADVVDDSRAWHPPGSPLLDPIDRNHEEVLARADVVLANCEPVVERMRRFAPQVHLVPNGCELPDALPVASTSPSADPPKELAGLEGPLIGYVGNLSLPRLDLPLLDTIVRARPGWQFVFVGSAHLDRSIYDLDALPNVHLLGVKPYNETQRFVRAFDVALIPHVDDEMTRSMHPLKAFVYSAAGVPVVSTPIANLGALDELIAVADGPDEFLAAIEVALRTGRQPPDLRVLAPHTWTRRVEQVLRLIDDAAIADPP